MVLPNVPLVERETNACDPQSSDLYLRGVRNSRTGEQITVSAQVTGADGQVRRGQLDVVVAPGDISDASGRGMWDDLINQVASETGVPPQILKSQISTETRFDPNKYRYEPMTLDLQRLGDTLSGAMVIRNDPAFKPYISRHLYEGKGLLPPVTTQPCLVLLGPVAAPGSGEAGCASVDASNAHAAPTVIANPAAVQILARRGLPATTTTYRQTTVVASAFVGGTSIVAPVVLEAPLWSLNGGREFLGLPSAGVTPGQDPNQLQIDYATNKVLLGRALRMGERIVLRYSQVQTENVGMGAPCQALPPSALNGRTSNTMLTFAANDTIGSWLLRNARATPPGTLTGNVSERKTEFSLDFTRSGTGAVSLAGLTDSRLRVATAQFIAAGSFGLSQQTIDAWLTPNRALLLDRVFDLKQRCLYELMTGPTRERDGLRLAAANHLHNAIRPTCTTCSDSEWLERWAAIVNKYNPNGNGYELRLGRNDIARIAVTRWGPQ